jgi:Cu+-exporting ATPase
MEKQTQEVTLDLFGMTCANCALRIEKGLSKVTGVEEARVNFAGETAYVRSTDLVTIDGLLKAVEKLGYSATLHSEAGRSASEEKHRQERRSLGLRFGASAVFSIPLLYSMVSHFSWLSFMPSAHILMNPWLQLGLAAPVQFYLGASFYKGAFRALVNRSANMDVLVALGTSAAFGYSLVKSLMGVSNELYYETSAVLITFILGGKWMELAARGRSSDAIRSLLHLRPQRARLKRENSWVELPAEYIKSGDLILVEPGERIAADGSVLEGSSAVDESMLTGESMPVEKSPQSKVIGGSVNGNGALVVRAERVGSDSVLSSIIRIVEEAQASRAPLQRIADRISAVFVPVVVGIALLDFVLWMFLDPWNAGGALKNAIAVLVIACPCALGLATPISLLVGTGRAAGLGILFRNAEALEGAASLQAIAFDKTGTLTEGRPAVVSVRTSGASQAEVFSLAASAESRSEHPLAKAIVRAAEKQGLSLQIPSSLEAEPGGGITAVVDGVKVVAGKRSFVSAFAAIPEDLISHGEQQEKSGQSTVWVFAQTPDPSFAVFALEDQMKSTTVQALLRLRELGIRPVLLTGDNAVVAGVIAQRAGISEVHAGLSPAEKSQAIEELQKSGLRVGMTGDGINDAPALARADVGFAMGNGTDIAMETAAVVLVKGDLLRLADSIALGRATVRNIRQNFFWAMAYNAVGIPVAAAGLLAPWIAGAAMAMSSVSVVANALRLMRAK